MYYTLFLKDRKKISSIDETSVIDFINEKFFLILFFENYGLLNLQFFHVFLMSDAARYTLHFISPAVK